jgi:hypothetical protein
MQAIEQMRIPKGMYGVYVLWCPIEYRTVKTLARFGSAVKDGWIPFIVGYGQRYRASVHWKRHTNSHEARIVRKMKMDGVSYAVTFSLITSDINEAKAKERHEIGTIGRTDLGTGPLTNKQPGGESGEFGPETRKKMSRSKKEWAKTQTGQAHLRKLLEAAHTPEAKAKMSRTKRVQAKTNEGQAHIRKMHEIQGRPEGKASLSRAARRRMTTTEGRAHLKQLYEAQRTPEALAKMSRTKRKWYRTKEGQAAQRKLVEAARTPQARIKIHRSWQRRLKTGEGQATLRKMVEAAKKPEAIAKHTHSMKKWAASEAGQETIARVAAAQRAVTPQTAAIIRQRIASGDTQVGLAEKFGVSPRTIRRIRKRGY